MILYFAAVGSDLMPGFERATKGEEQNILFSYFDMELGGFRFRRKNWEYITEEELCTIKKSC
jgi:hypothetical protein